jgi:hypothetical protein
MRSVLAAAAGASLVLVALACSAVSPDAPSLDRDFELRAGATARIDGSDLTVRFDGVPNDSRCPTDVQCISAGDATVELHVSGGGAADASHEVHTHDEPHEARHGAWSVVLVKLEPRPVSTRPTPRGDYLVTLRVSRAR